MIDWIGLITFAGMIGVGFVAGYGFADSRLLHECRKQHNVYECVIVAVPKGKEWVYADK